MSSPAKKSASLLMVILAFAIVYIVWGSTYFFIQIAVKDFPPFILGALRFIIAGGMMAAWCVFKGEKIFEARLSSGENAVATPDLILPAKLTPRRSKVIRNKDETSKRTRSSRERLPPPLATNKLPYKLINDEVQRLKPSPRLQTLQYIFQNLQQLLAMGAQKYELAYLFHDAIFHQGHEGVLRHQ